MAGNPPLSGVTRRGSSSVVTNANPPLAGASATEAAQEAARETAREAAREKAREAARETAFATVEDLERAGVKVGYSAPSEFEYSYQEIKNLVRAKDDPVFSVALEEWGRKERVLSNRVDRREKRSADLINQIFNLIGFYSVFLGVVLTAVSQLVGNDCKPQCGKIWFPILLTVVAAAVIITGVSLKFTNLKELEESIQTEKQNQKEVARRESNFRTYGSSNFRFFEHTRELENKFPVKSFEKNKALVLLALIAVAGIFILSYFVILCDLWVIESLNRGL